MSAAAVSQQMCLWKDVRLPDEYYEHFMKTGQCINCRTDLNHEVHALNHFVMFHTIKVVPSAEPRPKRRRKKLAIVAPQERQRFFVLQSADNPGHIVWTEVSRIAFLAAGNIGKCTAFTVPTVEQPPVYTRPVSSATEQRVN